ncbi:ABC transporter permease [Planosporangium thailandense]|uniref:ABC transporter permease n=1 Tax=Planosporangium thailandense TaxID=765197 RepID=A0ABX0Y3J7_9ACTN|nr:ABC transporter permease [Planosporangium thailandense]
MARGVAVSFIVATVAFSVLRFAPGDPVLAILGDQATPSAVTAMRAKLGLDGNIFVQYLRFLGHAVRGDLGTSITSGVPVARIIGDSIAPTLSLVAMTAILALIFSVPLGLRLALAPEGLFSKVFRVAASLSLAMPGFFLGLLALLLFAIRWGVAPVAGFTSTFPGALTYLWLPALVICAQLVPILARVFRASVLRTLDEEFIEAAIVRGVSRPRFYWHYLIRPSIAPTIALLGYITGQLLGASVMIEMVFSMPGIGTRLVRAVTTRDYPTVQGILLVFGVLVVLITTLSELVIKRLDPRAGGDR